MLVIFVTLDDEPTARKNFKRHKIVNSLRVGIRNKGRNRKILLACIYYCRMKKETGNFSETGFNPFSDIVRAVA